jgi:hypothetical protein
MMDGSGRGERRGTMAERWRLALAALAGLCATASSAAAADCLPSTREVKFPDGSARLKTYVCRTADAAKPQVQIEFDRLSEAAAGSLVEGTPYPDLQRSLGSWRVLPNAVFAETKRLFDTYGTKAEVHSCYNFVAGAVGAKAYSPPSDKQVCDQQRTLWYFSFPDQAGITTKPIALPDDEKAVKTSTRWPDGWNFAYSGSNCDAKSPIECTILWRAARKSDLADYLANQAKLETQVDLPPDTQPADAPPPDPAAEAEQKKQAQEQADSKQSEARFFDLLQHLTADQWRDDFLTITGEYAECGGGMTFSLHIRQLVLDTAFVRNVSSEPVSLDGLVGLADPARALRKVEAPKPGTAGDVVPLAATVLKPGETIAIPLRMSFVPASSLGDLFTAKVRAAGERMYKGIMAAKPGTMFKEKESEGHDPIRKVRESFGPPTAPSPAVYAYGPAFDLKGLTLGGKRIDFDAASRNVLTIAAGEGYGSCPYLYAFDPASRAWVWHGKIIHDANAAAKEMTQRVDFGGLSTRFRISEEELEASYIRRVRLEIERADGTVLWLMPRNRLRPEGKGAYTLIKAGRSRDYVFAPPPGLDAQRVIRSTLIVTGYYRPYAGMQIVERETAVGIGR